jgi:hypothetical protein
MWHMPQFHNHNEDGYRKSLEGKIWGSNEGNYPGGQARHWCQCFGMLHLLLFINLKDCQFLF